MCSRGDEGTATTAAEVPAVTCTGAQNSRNLNGSGGGKDEYARSVTETPIEYQ